MARISGETKQMITQLFRSSLKVWSFHFGFLWDYYLHISTQKVNNIIVIHPLKQNKTYEIIKTSLVEWQSALLFLFLLIVPGFFS